VVLWLEEYAAAAGARGQPYFLWIHYWDPHYPFSPSAPFDQVSTEDCPGCPDGSMPTIRRIQSGEQLSEAEAAHLLRYYDAEIAFLDFELGRLLTNLQRLQLDRETLVVVLGDHGESFGEQGRWLHGGDLLDPEIHVPLIMWYPGVLPAGEVVEAVSRSVDVMPTVLDLFGIPIPATVEGQSLLPIVRGEQRGNERFAIAELADRSIVTIVTHDWQLLKNNASGVIRLHRTDQPAAIQEEFSAVEPQLAAELENQLDQWQATHP
jgi:arylsulfatase A-like enzyme